VLGGVREPSKCGYETESAEAGSMKEAIEIIKDVSVKTDSVILFHSLSGKDSIALLDLCAPFFSRIVCIYLYVVKDLDHIGKYRAYAQNRYPGVEFFQMPHFALLSYIKAGYMGCAQNEKQRVLTLSNLVEKARIKTGIEWVGFGMKKTDGLNRRLMLQRYDKQGISEKTKKFYPLSIYKNGDVLSYIEERGLIRPERYGKGQSSGTAINDVNYLLYLRENYPDDLQRVFAEFPAVQRLLYEHDHTGM